jgi:hypothetical protein
MLQTVRADFALFRPSSGIWFVRSCPVAGENGSQLVRCERRSGRPLRTTEWRTGKARHRNNSDQAASQEPNGGSIEAQRDYSQCPNSGASTDQAVQGDDTGEWKQLYVAIWRPSTGEWVWSSRSEDLSLLRDARLEPRVMLFAPGDYDGDGKV